MKAATAIGIGIAFVGLLGGAIMEGTPPGSLFNVPAILIIFGGLLGASLASVRHGGDEADARRSTRRRSPPSARTWARTVRPLVGYAEQARQDGLLALEEELEEIDDEFTRKGLQLVVDGTDPELVREILEAEIDGMAARHKRERQRSSRRPAASRRRWASSARSWASSTCCRTSTARDARPRDLRRVHRHALRRRRRQRHLPAGRPAPQAAVRRRGRGAHARSSRASSPSRPATTRASCREAHVASSRPPSATRADEDARAEPACRRRRRGGRRRRSHGRATRQEAPRRPARSTRDERWLLTYADMITLLMALFMVLFSMSSVNVSKFEALQRVAQRGVLAARSIPGGEAIKQTGGATPARHAVEPADQLARRDRALTRRGRTTATSKAAAAEQEDFRELKAADRRATSRSQGLAEQGRDDASTSAAWRSACSPTTCSSTVRRGRRQAAARPLLDKRRHASCTEDTPARVRVEGHTDTSRSRGGRTRRTGSCRPRAPRPSCAPCSAPAASPARFEAAGRADLDPIARNATEAGRRSQPPRRDHPAARHQSPAGDAREAMASCPRPVVRHGGHAMKSKLKIIIPLVLLARSAACYKFVLAKAAAEAPKPKVARRGLRPRQGLPRQPRGRPLRQARRRAGLRPRRRAPAGRRRPRRAPPSRRRATARCPGGARPRHRHRHPHRRGGATS